MNIILIIVSSVRKAVASVIPGQVKLCFNNLIFIFRPRCLSCNWKKRSEDMRNPDLCYACASEPVNSNLRMKPAAKRVVKVA